MRTSVDVFSFSRACRFLFLSSSGDGSWAGSSSGSPAAGFEAKTQKTFSGLETQSSWRVDNNSQRGLDLGLLVLYAPDTAGAVHHRVLRHDLARVDLAAGADDAAAGEDHVPAEISWERKRCKTDTTCKSIEIKQ